MPDGTCLLPGAKFRVSVPDKRGARYYNRSEKNKNKNKGGGRTNNNTASGRTEQKEEDPDRDV